MWYAKVPKFPEFPSVKNGVCEALFFSLPLCKNWE